MTERQEIIKANQVICDIREVICRTAATGEGVAKHSFIIHFKGDELKDFDVHYFGNIIFDLLEKDSTTAITQYSISNKIIDNNRIQVDFFLKVIKKEYLKFEV